MYLGPSLKNMTLQLNKCISFQMVLYICNGFCKNDMRAHEFCIQLIGIVWFFYVCIGLCICGGLRMNDILNLCMGFVWILYICNGFCVNDMLNMCNVCM